MRGVSELGEIGRLLIIGAARSGQACAGAARRVLPQVGVTVSDQDAAALTAAEQAELAQAGIEVALGRDDAALLDGCGLVVKSPGVPGEIPLIQEARARGIPVWGEVEFASRFLDNVLVGVTGTNGKTTTAELIGHILRNAGRPSRVAGNVGTALSTLVGVAGGEDILVVELSSFQLEDSVEFRPDIAVLLNLSDDHLDRHSSQAHYYSAKLGIFRNQWMDDLAVLNLDDPAVAVAVIADGARRVWFSHRQMSGGAGESSAEDTKKAIESSADKGNAIAGEGSAGSGRGGSDGEGSDSEAPEVAPYVYFQEGFIRADTAGLVRLTLNLRNRLLEKSGVSIENSGKDGRKAAGTGEDSQEVVAWAEAGLKGEHNLENSLAATAVCLALGLSPQEVAAGLTGFPGVRHRLQEVAVIDGVTYVNDSKATNVDAALKALTAFDGGVHLILGGSLKGCSFDPLARAAAAGKVREVLLIGEASGQIASSMEAAGAGYVMAGRLEEAVRMARSNAHPGDVVLLAPACASFDQYENYEERGEHFISLVSGMTRDEG